MTSVPRWAAFWCLLALVANLEAAEFEGDPTTQGSFGFSVSISGDNALVGAQTYSDKTGAAYFFQNFDSAARTERGPFTGGTDQQSGDNFGCAVSLSGNSGLVGALGRNEDAGAAYFFADVDGTAPPVELTAPGGGHGGDLFGVSVSLDGNSALVGADGTDKFRGAAYYFGDVGAPASVKMLVPDSTASSPNLPRDNFGASVGLSAGRALVGADGKDSFRGAAYLFDLTGESITQVKLTAYDGSANDLFGSSVSLAGNTALVGAVGALSGKGAAYFFADLGDPANQVKLTAFDGAVNDVFGRSVSLSSGRALIGAPGSSSTTGAAYLFLNLADSTPAQVKLTPSDNPAGGRFGNSVALDGDRFLIGAYEAANFSGRAYSGSVSSVTTLDCSESRTIDGISFVSETDWIIGEDHSGNHVTLLGGNRANVTAAGKAVYIGQNGGSDNSLIVQGSVTANAVNISAASGGGSGNVLQIGDGGKVSAGVITVNQGGTLLLGGSTGTDRIGINTAITIGSGGSLSTSGLSEGTATAGSAPGFGALTLKGGASIDFAAGQHGSTLLAASGAVSGMGLISIFNWSGAAGMDDGALGNDRLLFVADPQFSSAQLAQFQFYDDGNSPFALGAEVIRFNEFYELTPVPEPATWLAGILTASTMAVGFVRRFRSAKS